MDFEKEVETWLKACKKDIIDRLKLHAGKSFQANELQVLVATEAKEKGTRGPHVNLVFLWKSEEILPFNSCLQLVPFG